MQPLETQFEQELEIFRREAEGAAQFFYAYLAIHQTAANHKSVLELLNHSALFWNTALAALQTGAFIVLGRVFDQHSAHNLDRLLRIAQAHPHIFSKAALGRRRQGGSAEEAVWLQEFVQAAYEPSPADFRRIRAYAQRWRRVYDSHYRALRNKVFAHKELSDDAQVAALFAQTKVRELQRLLAFLGSLYDAL